MFDCIKKQLEEWIFKLQVTKWILRDDYAASELHSQGKQAFSNTSSPPSLADKSFGMKINN